MRPSPVFFVGLLFLSACAEAGPPEPLSYDAAVHQADVRRFAAAREAELDAPDSWLSLIALHWLEEGETTIGSDPSNGLVLPEGKAAPFVGHVLLAGEELRFISADGIDVTEGIDSTLSLPAGSGAFPPDVSGDPVVTETVMGSAGPGKAKILRHGDISWIKMGRGSDFALRVRDNSSEVYDAFDGIERFPTSEAWRVTGRWVPHTKTVSVPNVLGTASDTESPAHVAFWIDGTKYTLDVTGDADDARFMLVFADETSGSETYGGGRYVWFDAPGPDGRIALDFNLAYNPPCVWTPFATCPLPSRDNRLAVGVEAGEKDWVH